MLNDPKLVVHQSMNKDKQSIIKIDFPFNAHWIIRFSSVSHKTIPAATTELIGDIHRWLDPSSYNFELSDIKINGMREHDNHASSQIQYRANYTRMLYQNADSDKYLESIVEVKYFCNTSFYHLNMDDSQQVWIESQKHEFMTTTNNNFKVVAEQLKEELDLYYGSYIDFCEALI